MPKDFPYKKMFDVKLLRLIESGMLDSIGNHWKNDVPECKTVPEDVASLALGLGTIIYIASGKEQSECVMNSYLFQKSLSACF